MTPVLCCGFECGVDTGHWTLGAAAAFDTGTVRSGARSLRIHPAAANAGQATSAVLASSNLWVWCGYVRFASLPTSDIMLFELTSGAGVGFRFSDSTICAAYRVSTTVTFGATGVAVTTGAWYGVDVKVDNSANPWLMDAKVDGVACAQVTRATAASASTEVVCGVGVGAGNKTFDAYFDDVVASQTLADYPIGAGYVNHFVPTADGTHNIAGANDFERSATGTDITNAITTAFQLIDDVPLKSGVVSEYINLIAPPNATDYVEVVYGPAPGISTPTVAPRAVEVICAYASASAGTNNLRLALNDNGTTNDVLNTTTGPGTTATYARKHYATAPTGGAWTLSGAGNFNNLRMRCLTNDAAPDPWFASTMVEAWFPYASLVLPVKRPQMFARSRMI